MTEPVKNPFIVHLQNLANQNDRGVLASLRRGLGQPPGSVPEMFRYVVPFLPANPRRSQESAYYLVGALFAFHPKSCDEGNLGSHLARARDENNADALERRFTVLLTAHPDDLPGYLRQIVSFLKSKDIPVNWEQLLRDLQNWDHPDGRAAAQKRWAGSFWSRRQPSSEEQA